MHAARLEPGQSIDRTAAPAPHLPGRCLYLATTLDPAGLQTFQCNASVSSSPYIIILNIF